MKGNIAAIIVPDFSVKVSRPLLSSKVSAGFPSPAEDYVEGRIDLNRDLIKHSLSTFYIRVMGDSMSPLIEPKALLIVDRMMETTTSDIVVARFGDELCVKELRLTDDGMIWLVSRNPDYKAFPICEEDDFEIWGRVMHIIHSC